MPDLTNRKYPLTPKSALNTSLPSCQSRVSGRLMPYATFVGSLSQCVLMSDVDNSAQGQRTYYSPPPCYSLRICGVMLPRSEFSLELSPNPLHHGFFALQQMPFDKVRPSVQRNHQRPPYNLARGQAQPMVATLLHRRRGITRMGLSLTMSIVRRSALSPRMS